MVPKKQKPRKSWITSDLTNLVNIKNKLYKEWKKDTDDLNKKEMYLEFQKILKTRLRTAKNNFEKKQLQNADSKKMWLFVQTKLNRTLTNRQIGDIKNNDEIIKEDLQKAKFFNKYFCTVVSKLNTSLIPPITQYDIPEISINTNTMFITPTDETEVYNTILQLKNKNGGYDNIHASTIKLAAKYIAPSLSYIINKTISEGTCPSQFKHAEICPVYKNGARDMVNNYRPIALISNLAKVFEKIVFKRILNFILKNKLLSERQFGFLEKKGTEDAIALLSRFIYENLSLSSPTLVTFLDYSKAFDTVNHQILLSKLYNMGIRGINLSLISSYLQDRKQVVKVNGIKSDPIYTNVGVPQGSILGPLLFLLYINDLLIFDKTLIAYADDTVVPNSAETWGNLAVSTSNKLDIIYSWLYKNKLVLNINKSAFVTFGNYRDSVPQEITVKMNDQLLTRVQSSKYLGVTYDFNIKWDVHISNIVKRTKYLVYVFYKLKYILTKKQLLSLYYGLFHSVAVYAIIGWGGVYKTSFEPLDRLQQRIFKTIGVKDQDSDRPLYIKQVFVLNSIMYQYNELRNEHLEQQYNTRHRSVILPRHSLTIGQRSYIYYAIKYFNKLPNHIKNLEVNKKNKCKVKEFIKKLVID